MIKTDDEWMTYESGWKFYKGDIYDEFYIDIGSGEARILFYEPSKEERSDLLEQITIISRQAYETSIIENMKSDIIAQELMYADRYKVPFKEEIAFMHVRRTGIANPSHLCHLIVVCQALYNIDDIVKIVEQCSSKSPSKELNIIFNELSKPFDEKSVEVRNLAKRLKINFYISAEVTFTFKLVLDKIEQNLRDKQKSIYDYFKLNDNIDYESSFIIDTIPNDITQQIVMRLMSRSTKYNPAVLLVHIGRYNDFSKVHVTDLITIESKHVEYKLCAIIAYDTDHYMYLRQIDEEKWIGFDDNTAFEVDAGIIHWLYGWNANEQSPFEINTTRRWIANLLIYKKS